MSFNQPSSQQRNARADLHREWIEDDVAGRRLIKEAERAEAIEEGLPLHRSVLARLRAALRRHPE